MAGKAASGAKRNFILQQGFGEPEPSSCSLRYSSLLFQPRLVAIATLLGIGFQSSEVFLALAAILWWSALLPRWSPFDALYNALLARKSGVSLVSAPAPRRFSQGLAGTFALAIGLALGFEWSAAALALQVLFLLAIAALAFGRFCLGSFIYHTLSGRARFARQTLPWARGG
jgi:hypothetical protein